MSDDPLSARVRTQHDILGVRVDDLSTPELRETLRTWLLGDVTRLIVTPNAEFIILAQDDPEFKQILGRADLALPDTVSLRFAVAALSEARLQHRHTGADTLIELAELAMQTKRRLMILGGSPRKTQRAAAVLRQQFAGLDIVCFDPGIVDNHHVRLSEATLAGIERLQPRVIAVALGHGKQERVMEILKIKLPSIRVLMGIGGAADYVAKAVTRAPQSWQNYGFEWAWRLMQEPWRWRRIFTAVVIFPLRVVWVTLVTGRFVTALMNVSDELKRHFTQAPNLNP